MANSVTSIPPHSGTTASPVPEGEIAFQAVRDHLQTEYDLSAGDWEKVERILSGFSNSPEDQTISRAEFFSTYDENLDQCSDSEVSSDFLGEDLPVLSGIFHADFECDEFENHPDHPLDFERGVRIYEGKMAEMKHDFALWQAIGIFLQGEFKIPESRQIRIVPSCGAPDEKQERYYLHLKKDLENALRDWFDSQPAEEKERHPVMDNSPYYCSEIMLGLLRDNPEMAANDLFAVIGFFKANPDFLTHSFLNVMNYVFPDRYPELQDGSFRKGPYFDAALEEIDRKFSDMGSLLASADFARLELSSFISYSAWYWESGLGDLFREIAFNIQQYGQYTIMTDRGPFTFFDDQAPTTPWSNQ